MGFGGAKQQVPSPWGKKQFKHVVSTACRPRVFQIALGGVLARRARAGHFFFTRAPLVTS